MIDTMVLDTSDTEKKIALRKRNREAQTSRRARSKRDKDIVTILQWELTKIARATHQNDFARVQTIVMGLEPSLLGSDHGSPPSTLQWSDSFSDTSSAWVTSPSLFGPPNFNLPLASFGDLGTMCHDTSSLFQMVTDTNS